MTIYFALLRGINVSGHNMIKMAELKKMFEAMGFERVQTYINSGNVMFESEEGEELLEEKIESEISKCFGFNIAVILRSASELASIIDKCPFDFKSLAEGQSIHLTFLKKPPTDDTIDKLPEVELNDDDYLIAGRDIYFFYSGSMLDSNLPKKFQKVLPATARNWKTVLKLQAMADALNSH
ncbi:MULTISPECIES: DUF1697 domain-containing protein [Bacillales]|uniref:DUF1697 domain-containing protein n=1 Tax=Bacillales TaxID=1385 RepID=UPI0006A7F0F1|nr:MULTISPECIES: DUF1697 domain-containing protein [Bacillales]OBZ17474.1 hypothetical protein A7975_06310 [Bacillus sp. FJAT-26390]